MRGLKLLAIVLMPAFLFQGCLEDIEEAPLELPENVLAPTGLSATIGDREVSLTWEHSPDASFYRVYRAFEETGRERKVAETPDSFYVDTDVSNGQVYHYAVSSVSGEGIEGSLSSPIRAVPSLYAMLINGGAEYTSSRSVVLQLTAPATTRLMMLSNDSLLTGGTWESYVQTTTWLLTDGDGPKTVYARFRDENDAISPVIERSILLDTYTEILDLAFTPGTIGPGGSVHFTMNILNDEISGEASVEVEGYTDPIPLLDNGRGGDTGALDGIYEVDFTFPERVRGTDLTVTGRFTDRAGNVAAGFEAAAKLSFTDPPEPVELIAVDDSTTSSITIRWRASEEDNFAAYRIYRDTAPGVMEQPLYLVKQLGLQSQTSYPDGNLKEGQTYYYRIFVVNDLDETAGSNELEASTFDAYPAPVVLDTLSSVGADRVTLTWSINQNTDFESYRIYRSTSPGVTLDPPSQVVHTETDREKTSYDDFGLDLGSNTYYYRIYVFDESGKNSRSNEVSTGE